MNTFGGKKRERRSVDRWPGGTPDAGPDRLRPTRIVSPSAPAIRPVWRVLACVVGAVVCSGLPSEAHGQDDITIRIIEEPYRQPNAFLVPYFEGLLGRNLTVDGQAIEGKPDRSRDWHDVHKTRECPVSKQHRLAPGFRARRSRQQVRYFRDTSRCPASSVTADAGHRKHSRPRDVRRPRRHGHVHGRADHSHRRGELRILVFLGQ